MKRKKTPQERCEENQGWVWQTAQRYAALTGCDVEDLAQEGFIGVLKAAEKYREELGFKFLTYARWYIQRQVLLFIWKNIRQVHVPLSLQGKSQRPRILEQRIGSIPLNEAEDVEDDEYAALTEEETARSEADARVRAALVRQHLHALGRNGEVMRFLYWEEDDLRKAGGKFKVSHQRIAQIRNLVIRKLKRSELLRGLWEEG